MDPAYTSAQLAEYLSYIGLPESFHPSANPVLDLVYLSTLITHQITAIPYENLSIHYSPQHAITLDPQALFAKMVASRRGRGGYCMENSILFNHMLRAIGFDAHLAGVRIRPRLDGVPQGESYTGWVHLVNIVTIPGEEEEADEAQGGKPVRYAVDVGFGGDGMTLPMPLVAGRVHHNSLGTQEVRLVRGFIPNQRFRGPGAHQNWIYQVRNGREKEWVPFFAFNDEFEFTEDDFANISFYTSQSPASHQTVTPLAIRFLRGTGEDGRAKVVGKVMMAWGTVKRNVTGKTEVFKVCETEEERIKVLRDLFAIHLTDEEVVSIKGRVAELVGKAA